MENQRIPASSLQLLVLSLASGVVYAILAFLLFHFLHRDPLAFLTTGYSLVGQALAGLAFGLASALLIGYFMLQPPISDVLRDFAIVQFVARTRLSTFDRVQVSVVAGIGEELLFRGAIQPLIGIWWTSVIFIALHGYFKFTSAGHVLFAAMMFSLSVGLGLLFEWAGIFAAMLAHALYDFLLLHGAQKWNLISIQDGNSTGDHLTEE